MHNKRNQLLIQVLLTNIALFQASVFVADIDDEIGSSYVARGKQHKRFIIMKNRKLIYSGL